ncbi:MAG: delta-60 repeat domain-containing protein [Pyrinomonadaceae bacterium]
MAYALVLQADGKLVAAGTTYSDFALARYNSNGTLDTTFGTGGKITTDFGDFGNYVYASDVVIQPDGKIVAAGGSRSDDFEDDSGVFALARYNADGTLDATFGSGGKVITDFGYPGYVPGLSGLALQADGKIVAAGTVRPFNEDFALVRYNTNGTLDTTFGAGGKITTDFGGSDRRVRCRHSTGRQNCGGWLY